VLPHQHQLQCRRGTKHYTNGNDSNNRSTHNCRSTAESADYQTQAGDLQGVAENNVFAFKDIPYASPPVGDLRWRKPQPASAWQVYAKADANGRFNRRFESTSEIV